MVKEAMLMLYNGYYSKHFKYNNFPFSIYLVVFFVKKKLDKITAACEMS